MRSRFRRHSFKREEDTREFKRQEKERIKKQNEENEKKFFDIFKETSKISNKSDKFVVYKEGLADFFNEVNLDTNKIHIIRGNNGQGKSTLLSNIVNSNFLGVLDAFSERLKISSTNKAVANALNYELAYSPYKRDDEGFIRSNLKYNLTNLNNSVTLYTDFSISFFRENNNCVFSDITEEYDKNSNGERKIDGINRIFYNLKKILSLKEEELFNGLNLFVVMDEPESGLSLEIQAEFCKKVKRYLNIAKKNNKISLTFIISSHSFVWEKSSDLIIHNINSFKKDGLNKKEHKNVFI